MKGTEKNTLILSILIPLAIGSVSALLAGNIGRYAVMNRPSISPPAFVFPIVWTALYILMGISAWRIGNVDSAEKEGAMRIYGVQLFFNFCWSIVFFRFSFYLAAFFFLLALLVAVAVMIVRFRRIDACAAYLQIPYFLWCCFAAVLNFMVYQMNK